LPRPAHGTFHRLTRVLVADGVFGALVERHENIAAEGKLRVDGGFGSEGVEVAVQVRAEDDAVLGDAAQAAEAEDLVAAGVGEDGARPGHEAMQTTEPLDEIGAGTQI